jgi:hypothetical protein
MVPSLNIAQIRICKCFFRYGYENNFSDMDMKMLDVTSKETWRKITFRYVTSASPFFLPVSLSKYSFTRGLFVSGSYIFHVS